MGRAARHVLGEVVMYADAMTGSMKNAIDEVDRLRKIQQDYNKKHGIKASSISKPIREKLIDQEIENALEISKKGKYIDIDYASLPPKELKKEIKRMEETMQFEAENLNFEEAARLRDKIRELRKTL